MRDYIIRGVSPEEYNFLKSDEEELTGAHLDLQDVSNGVKSLFIKYNPERSYVGIWVNEKLALERRYLDDSEIGVVERFYGDLERKLEHLRLPEENWIDRLDEETDEEPRDDGEDDIPF